VSGGNFAAIIQKVPIMADIQWKWFSKYWKYLVHKRWYSRAGGTNIWKSGTEHLLAFLLKLYLEGKVRTRVERIWKKAENHAIKYVQQHVIQNLI